MTQSESLVKAHYIVSNILKADIFLTTDAIRILSTISEKNEEYLFALKQFKKFKKTPFFKPDKEVVRIIIVDPGQESIYEEVVYSDLSDFYDEIGHTLLDRLYLPSGDCCYYNDMGSYRKHEASFFIERQHIYGKAIIVGIGSDFQATSHTSGIEYAKKHVEFLKFRHKQWAEKFFKDLGIDMKQKIGDNGYTIAEILNISSTMPKEIQDKIKKRLIEVDIFKGNVLRFLESLERQL